MRRIFVFVLLLLPAIARADFTWDSTIFYFSDTFTTDSTASYSLTAWSTSFNIEIGKSKEFFAGWNLLGFTQANSDGTTSPTYTSTEMGPRLMYMSKSGDWQIAVSYHLSSTNVTSYDPGTGTAQKLKGTAIFGELGYAPEFSNSWRLGFKLCYYAPSFTDSITNDTNLTQVSYTRAAIYPALAITTRW